MVVEFVLSLGQFFYNLAYCFGYMCITPLQDISSISYTSPITGEYVSNDILGIGGLSDLIGQFVGADFTLLDVIAFLVITSFLVALVVRMVNWIIS